MEGLRPVRCRIKQHRAAHNKIYRSVRRPSKARETSKAAQDQQLQASLPALPACLVYNTVRSTVYYKWYTYYVPVPVHRPGYLGLGHGLGDGTGHRARIPVTMFIPCKRFVGARFRLLANSIYLMPPRTMYSTRIVAMCASLGTLLQILSAPVSLRILLVLCNP